MRSGSFSTHAASASIVVMLATKDRMTTIVSHSGVFASPASKMELRNVSMLQAQKNAMPTCRSRMVFHTMRMLRRSLAMANHAPFACRFTVRCPAGDASVPPATHKFSNLLLIREDV